MTLKGFATQVDHLHFKNIILFHIHLSVRHTSSYLQLCILSHSFPLFFALLMSLVVFFLLPSGPSQALSDVR